LTEEELLFSSVLYTMETHFVFYMLCYTILFHFLAHNEATPWAIRQCQQVNLWLFSLHGFLH